MDDKGYVYNLLYWYNMVGLPEKDKKTFYAEQDVTFLKNMQKITEDIMIDFSKKQNLEKHDFSLLIDVAKKLAGVKIDISFLWKVVEKALQKYPEDIDLNSRIGRIYEEHEQKDKAIECFEHALKNKKFTDDTSLYLDVREVSQSDLERRYELKEKQGPKKDEGKYEMWEGDAENSFKHLLDLYFEKGEHHKIDNWCAWLENQRITNTKEYLAPTYIKLREMLGEQYTPYLKKGEEKKEEKKREKEEKIIRPTLKDFALSPPVKKEIDFILHKIKKDKSPDSILLYGPPGCGKTELAKCIAGELEYEYHELDSRVLDKYIGESEKNVREVFEELRKSKKGVLLIDEFESFGIDRGRHLHGWEHTLSSEMLQQIEKTLKCENTQILIIAATNLLEMLDKAMIRRGRFNYHISLGLPDLDVREEIFKIKLNKLKTKGKKVSDKLDYNKFVKETEGLTGADIHQIVFGNIDFVLYEKKKEDAEITNDIVLEAIKKCKQDKKPKQDWGGDEFQPQYQ